MAGYLDQIPTPKMTFTPQSGAVAAAPTGTALLWLGTDGVWYVTDDAGLASPLAWIPYVPIANSAHPPRVVHNAAGRPIMHVR